MIAKDKILVFDRPVVLVAAAPVKISLALIGQIAHETVLKIGGRLFWTPCRSVVARRQAIS